MTGTSDSYAPDGDGADLRLRRYLVDSREICFTGLSNALTDVGVVPDPQWYRSWHAIASPDLLLMWEQQFGPLPEAVDEIIVRCRTYVMAAAQRLIVIDEYAQIAKAARTRGQRLAIGSNSSTNTVTAAVPVRQPDGSFPNEPDRLSAAELLRAYRRRSDDADQSADHQ